VSRPRVVLVGWRLGNELEGVIRAGRDRFDYTVISMDLSESLREQVDWRRLPRPPFGSFRLGWAIFFALGGLRLTRAKGDLVHCVGPLPVVPNRVDLDTVTFCQAAYDEATGGRIKGSASAVGWRMGQWFTVALERWWFRRRVRVLVGISDGSGADLRRLYPQTRVAVVARGIDLGRFTPDDRDRQSVRAEHGVPPDAVVALFVDQQHRPLKGLEIAIRGFAAARRSGTGPDQLWVAGTGNDRYAPLARTLGVGDRVRFFGHTAAIERLYRGANLFVLPTAYEAFCRAAHEAAACGLPVIAPPVNGIRALIGDDEAGIVAARDPEAVGRALASLAADPERRARMGVVARRRVAQFDERAVAAQVLALHESLLAGQNHAQTAESAASG
jgi:glycosyltransferase involved in cell wall biosynthesis